MIYLLLVLLLLQWYATTNKPLWIGTAASVAIATVTFVISQSEYEATYAFMFSWLLAAAVAIVIDAID